MYHFSVLTRVQPFFHLPHRRAVPPISLSANRTRMWGSFFPTKIWKMGYMDPYNFSDMRRELVYQEFMLHYLQEEQKKRWEKLNEIKRIWKQWKMIRNLKKWWSSLQKRINAWIPMMCIWKRSMFPSLSKLMKMGSSSYPALSSKAVTHSVKPLMRLLPVSRKLSSFAWKIQSPNTSIRL